MERSQRLGKANVVPIHKKSNRHIYSNYRPVSLLPICGKIFERILYKALHNHLNDNFLLCESQSGFRCGDSCVNQLLSIINMIYSSFDKNPSLEVCGVFLDISRAFDRAWHAGLL